MHSCPECYEACDCNGDVDSAMSAEGDASIAAALCVHYLECGDDDEEN